MPLIGVLLGGIDFSGMAAQIGDVSITYGVFLQSVIDFIIVAFVIFLVVKAINKAQELGQEEDGVVEEKVVEPSEEVKLLREIRDTLRR